MERTGQCHCGSLRVIATGEPDRVYLCHCGACQRRTGTAFHFGATYPKERVRLDGERKIYERDPTAATVFDFISVRIAAPPFRPRTIKLHDCACMMGQRNLPCETLAYSHL
jgi:hypothetical protein